MSTNRITVQSLRRSAKSIVALAASTAITTDQCYFDDPTYASVSWMPRLMFNTFYDHLVFKSNSAQRELFERYHAAAKKIADAACELLVKLTTKDEFNAIADVATRRLAGLIAHWRREHERLGALETTTA